MSLIRLNCAIRSRMLVRNFGTEFSASEYTNEPIYPNILSLTPEAKAERKIEARTYEIQRTYTVEEKIFKINMPRYYGWLTIQANEHTVPLQSLAFTQHCTRTHLVKSNTLPDYYIAYDSAASYIAKQLRSEIEDAIQFEFQGIQRNFEFAKDRTEASQKDDMMSKFVQQQINRVITNHLSPNVPHIMHSQVDYEPRHESFWVAGGFQSPRVSIKISDTKEKIAHKPADYPIMYYGKPTLTLRSMLPLEPIIPYSEASNESLDVPHYRLDPTSAGYFLKRVHAANIPGFWTGDNYEFGLLSYHTRGYIKDRSFGPADQLDALYCQGIFTSFAWLMAQACYQGFSTYNELTYPLTTQTVISDGQYWSFFSYQLNTVLMYRKNYETNKLRNICYATQPLKLFEGIDNNGKLIGFNDDVLKMLVQFYLNEPKERVDTEMKPYLGKRIKIIADFANEKKRMWLEKNYKHLVSNRPRHRLTPEIYQWEKIYKIKFDTRHHEAKRRPFELGQNPMKRRLNEHTSAYIPKVLRPGGPRSRKMWEKTYYPQ